MDERTNQQGWVLVTVAAVLVLLLGFAALAVDMGVMMSARASAQRAVDAAALAGAFTFVSQCTAPQPATAEDHARQTALNNNVLGAAITNPEVTVSVDVPNRLVTVSLDRSEPYYFAQVLGLRSANIRVQASAEASPIAVATRCTKPWFIPNTIGGRSANPCDECGPGNILVYGNGQVNQSYVSNQINRGAYYDINVKSATDPLGRKSFYAMAFPGDSPGPTPQYAENVAACTDATTTVCSSDYRPKTGSTPQLAQLTVEGVRNLVTINGSVTPDTWIRAGQYGRPDGSVSDTSHQLVTVPIWDVCSTPDFCPGATLLHANQNLRVVGYALVFVELRPGDVLRIRLAGVSGCGSGGAPVTQETGPLGVPVRLVRTS